MSDSEKDTSDTITIRVKDQGGDETFFKVKKTTKMSKVFGAYAQRKGVAITSLRFLIDGERIDAAETPKSLELEDQDQGKSRHTSLFPPLSPSSSSPLLLFSHHSCNHLHSSLLSQTWNCKYCSFATNKLEHLLSFFLTSDF